MAGIEPPVKVTVETPTEGVPPQDVVALPDVTRPLGNVSVRGAVRLATVPFGLLKVILRVAGTPGLTVAGLKDFLIVGGVMTGVVTVNVPLAVLVLLPLFVCKAPGGSELI